MKQSVHEWLRTLGALLRLAPPPRARSGQTVRRGGPDHDSPVRRRVLIDSAAASANRELPALLARPESEAVYHGFPLVEETRTQDWVFGAISAFDDEPEGCECGDGFVVAPDGSRAGIVWEVGDFATYSILPPCPERWGVYGVAFPFAVRGVDDLVECFRAVLPDLRAIHAGLPGKDR